MFSMLILGSCTEKTETELEKSAPVFAVRGPCGKHWLQRNFQESWEGSHSLGCVWILGACKGWGGLRQNPNVPVSIWSLTWICNEERLSKNTLQWPTRKVFMAQILFFFFFFMKWKMGAWCRSSLWVTLSLLRLGKLGLYWDTSAIANCLRAAAWHCLHRFLSCLLQVTGN